MLNCHYRPFVLLILIASINTIQAEESSEDSYKWGNYFKIGTQAYFQGEPMSGIEATASSGFLSTQVLTENSAISFSYSTAAYQVTRAATSREEIGDETSLGEFSYEDLQQILDRKPLRVRSYLLGYRYRFLPKEKLTPFVEAGIGLTDPVPTFDKGLKLAQSVAVGFSYEFHRKWAFYLESRGVWWRQDNASEFIEDLFGDIGKTVTVASNEFTIGIGYLR